LVCFIYKVQFREMMLYDEKPFTTPTAKMNEARFSLTDRTDRHQQVYTNVPHMGDRRQMPPMNQNFTRRSTITTARAVAETANRDNIVIASRFDSPFARIVDKREGIGNYEAYRDNFRQKPILGRNDPESNQSFAQQRAVDIEKQGLKIQLGEKTIQDLFWTRVPDETDTEWLAEKLRLVSIGMMNALPFNRQQRQKTVKQNLGALALTQVGTSNNLLGTILQQINQNRIQNSTDVLLLRDNYTKLMSGLYSAVFQLNAKQDSLLIQSIKNTAPVVIPDMFSLPYDKAPQIIRRFWNIDRLIEGGMPPAATSLELLAYAVSRARYPTVNGFRAEYNGKVHDLPINSVYRQGVGNVPRKHKLYLDMEDGVWRDEAATLKILSDTESSEPLERYGASPSDIAASKAYEDDMRVALMASLSGAVASGIASADDEEKKDEADDIARLTLASDGLVAEPSGETSV
jgi:hypothetical protein